MTNDHGTPDYSQILASDISADPVVEGLRPDSRTNIEETYYKKLREDEQIAVIKDNRELRRTYASHLFWFMCAWSFFVAVILLDQGFHVKNFYLESSVMIALLGTFMVSVVGLMLAIVRGLFPPNSN